MNGSKTIPVICLVFALAFCFAGCVCPGKDEVQYGSMRIKAVDGMTDEPISGAKVVFPEEGICVETGADGLTEPVELPCRADERHDMLCETDEGRTTVIVYAEGYVPYLLLYARVLPGRERETPTVYMFPDDGSLPVFEVIEAPPLEWAAEVVERFKP